MPNSIPTRTSNRVSRTWLRIALVGRNPKVTAMRAAILVTACLIVFRFVLLPVRVSGISMLPTYKERSVNLINRLSYFRHEPRRGDVVGIELAGHSIMYLKRIIGLPGETIAFVNGQVLINGKLLDEPYEKFPCDWNYSPVTLGGSEYFVVGDNRSMPQEDHTFGRCERRRIVGRVLL